MSNTKHPIGSFLGSVAGVFIVALILLWENYVWLGAPNVHYWQMLILSIPIVLANQFVRVLSIVYSCLLFITLIVQTLLWMKLATAPIF